MGAWSVYVHAALGVLLLVCFRVSGASRSRIIEAASTVGFAAALLGLASPPRWGVLDAAPDRWRVVGVGVAAAWALVAAVDRGSGRVESGVFVASAATSLAFFAGTPWLVPAMVFWACSSVALAALIYDPARPRGMALGLLATSDLMFVAGALSGRDLTQTWMLGELAGDFPGALWFSAAVFRVCLAVLMVRSDRIAEHAPVVPLALASAFLLLVGAGQTLSPGTTAVVGGFAVGVGLLIVASAETGPLLGAWVSASTIALAIASPGTAARAAIAGILGVSGAGLWTLSQGRGAFARALLVGVLPSTAAFGALSLAYSDAFSGLAGSGDRRLVLLGSIVMCGIGAVGAAISARAARGPRTDDWEPLAWLATIALACLAVWHGLPLSGSGIVPLPLGVTAVVSALGLVVLIVGAGAIFLGLRRLPPDSWPIPTEEPVRPRADSPRGTRFFASVAAVCWCAAGAAIVWTTVAGLRVGFL